MLVRIRRSSPYSVPKPLLYIKNLREYKQIANKLNLTAYNKKKDSKGKKFIKKVSYIYFIFNLYLYY